MINDISKFKLLTGEDSEEAHIQNIAILQEKFPQFDAQTIQRIYNDARAPMDDATIKRFTATFAFKQARTVLEQKTSELTSSAIKHSDESREPLSKPKDLSRQIVDRITETDYERFLKEHFADAPEEVSKYYYFDTDAQVANAQLLSRHIRFRLRLRVDSILLQFEESREGEKEELLQEVISPEQVEAIVQGTIPDGPIKARLSALGITQPLQMVGMTESTRHIAEILNGYCELERTRYPDGKVLHQIEYRSKDTETNVARQALGLSAEIRRAPSKLQEFFTHLKRMK